MRGAARTRPFKTVRGKARLVTQHHAQANEQVVDVVRRQRVHEGRDEEQHGVEVQDARVVVADGAVALGASGAALETADDLLKQQRTAGAGAGAEERGRGRGGEAGGRATLSLRTHGGAALEAAHNLQQQQQQRAAGAGEERGGGRGGGAGRRMTLILSMCVGAALQAAHNLLKQQRAAGAEEGGEWQAGERR